MDAWLTLVAAGVFEVGFTTCLKLEERSKWFIVPFLICAGISFTLLSQAMETIPLGTAYAVWTGIGAVGTVLVGALAFGERLKPATLALLGVVVLMIIGLKVIA
ncbi:MAG: multidrug efflux SMR transporter [Micropruina sp.]|nr:multidrug efflux SMR transporter [Micropruina sp.]